MWISGLCQNPDNPFFRYLWPMSDRKLLPILLFGFLLTFTSTFAQDPDVSLNHDVYHYIDRIDIQGVTGAPVYTDMKPYGRLEVEHYLRESAGNINAGLKNTWNAQNRILWDDRHAEQRDVKPILKYFFRNGRDFYHKRLDKINLYVNPILYLSGGLDRHNYADSVNNENVLNYRNTRGVRIRGSVFNKLGFFAEATENQAKMPIFVRNRYFERNTYFGEAFVKTFDDQTNLGFDYFNARGYLTYSPVREMRIKFGKDRYFAGNGFQSQFLSDYAPEHLFLHIDTRIWKFQYINHYGQMIDFLPNKADDFGAHPKKYFVFHQLNIVPNHWLSVGLFETIVYSPILPGGVRGFEIEYLNPLIFYRSAEQFLGSPDNALLGITWKANLLKMFQFYGQVNLDDFNFRRRSEGSGFHGNRHGVQMGLKYIDAFTVTGLDLQFEYNQVRPYTFTHFNPSSNYTHYGQYLAHASGANLREFIMIGRFQATERLGFFGMFSTMTKGLDSAGVNMGGDVFRPPLRVASEFGNEIGQGEKLQVTTLYGRASYQMFGANLYLEAEGRIRMEGDLRSASAVFGMRYNIGRKPIRY